MKYFRVKYSHTPDGFISIPEDQLEKAIRAQITGKIAVFDEGTVSGNHIIAIIPDYQRALGLNRDYQLTGEDYKELGTQRFDHSVTLEVAVKKVEGQLNGGTITKTLKDGTKP